jgi:hypothetical protein
VINVEREEEIDGLKEGGNDNSCYFDERMLFFNDLDILFGLR